MMEHDGAHGPSGGRNPQDDWLWRGIAGALGRGQQDESIESRVRRRAGRTAKLIGDEARSQYGRGE